MLSHSAYVDTTGFLHVVGEVRNNQPKEVVKVQVTVKLLDLRGSVLASASTFAYGSALNPGTTSPFEVLFLSELFAGIPNYRLESVWEKTEEVFKAQIQIEDSAIQRVSDGLSLVTGTVRNVGVDIVEPGVVIGSLYDEAGTIVAAALGLVDAALLAPGESATFTLVVEPPVDVVITSYVLQLGAA